MIKYQNIHNTRFKKEQVHLINEWRKVETEMKTEESHVAWLNLKIFLEKVTDKEYLMDMTLV